MLRCLLLVTLISLLAIPMAIAQGLPPDFGHPNKLLRVTYIDVDQGDAIFIRTPAGKNVLIDAGDDGDDAGKTIHRFLEENKIDRLHMVIISHAHDDHFGGFYYLLGKVRIGKILFGTRGTTARYKRLEAMIAQAKIPYAHVEAGERLDFGGEVYGDVLFAGPEDPKDFDKDWTPWGSEGDDESEDKGIDLNATSVVLRLVHGDVSFYLGGDATEHVENKLVDHYDELKCSIYKASHHGSGYSNTNRILDQIRSTIGIISCGEGNSFGHPHKPAMERLEAFNERIFRTDQGGTVNCWSNGKTYVVRDQSAPNDFLAAPKVVRYHPRAVRITFKTVKPSVSTLCWGLTGPDENEKKLPLATVNHELYLTELQPSSSYRFRIHIAAKGDESDGATFEGSFTTTFEDPTAAAITLAPFVPTPSPPFLKESSVIDFRLDNRSGTPLNDLQIEVFHTDTSAGNRLLQLKGQSLLAGAHVNVQAPWTPQHRGANELILRVKQGAKVIASRVEQLVPRLRRIVFDGNHDNRFVLRNQIANFLRDIRNQGYEVEVDRSGSISGKTLKGAHAYVVTHTTAPFRPSEVQALSAYLKQGGGLLVTTVCDYSKTHGPKGLNGLLAGLESAIRFNDDEILDETNNYGSHPSRKWIPMFHAFPSPLVDDPRIQGVITHGGASLLNDEMKPLEASDGVDILAMGDDDTYNVEGDQSEDGVLIATGTIPIVADAAEEHGEGRLVCFGGTHLTDKEYLDDIEKTHQTPRYNRLVIDWLSGRKAIEGKRFARSLLSAPKHSRTMDSPPLEEMYRKIRQEERQGASTTKSYLRQRADRDEAAGDAVRWVESRERFRLLYGR